MVARRVIRGPLCEIVSRGPKQGKADLNVVHVGERGGLRSLRTTLSLGEQEWLHAKALHSALLELAGEGKIDTNSAAGLFLRLYEEGRSQAERAIADGRVELVGRLAKRPSVDSLNRYYKGAALQALGV